MEDKRSLENISLQIKAIERNNENNLDSMTSIEMLLTSDNNGATKDSQLSEKIYELRNKINETINATNEIMTTIDENRKS